MSLDSKTIIFDKNINNNLSNSECKIFIKDYKDYKK